MVHKPLCQPEVADFVLLWVCNHMTKGVILIPPVKFGNLSILTDFANRAEESVDQSFLQRPEAFLIQLQLKTDFKFERSNVLVDVFTEIEVKDNLIDNVLFVSVSKGNPLFGGISL